MTAFVLTSAVLVLVVIAALALPLLRRHRGDDRAGEQADLAAYRERLAELQQEYRNGMMSDSELQAVTDELEHELLQAHGESRPDSSRNSPRPARFTAVIVALAIPLLAGLLYTMAGRPGLVTGNDSAGLSRARVQQLQSMPPQARIDALEDWLADNAGNARGWSLLAQAYRETEAFGDAASAFGRARAAGANDAWLIARQAEALLLANDRRFTRGVDRLLEEALAQDARNPLALMLSGQGALVGGDPAAAADYWRRLAETLPEDAEQRGFIMELVARAEAAASGSGEMGSAGEAGASIAVTVSLDSAMSDAAAPDDTVFVFARRPEAGGPPLAVARTSVGSLPTRIVLDDGDAMAPQFTISQAEEVIVTARVSRSGQAMAQSGDLEGSSDPISVGGTAEIELVIDRRLP